MKGHDALCPTPSPHTLDRKNCAYCNLIKVVREDYKTRHPKEGGKTYDAGWQDGFAAAIQKLQESA